MFMKWLRNRIDEMVQQSLDRHKEKPQAIDINVNVDSTEAEAKITRLSDMVKRFHESEEAAAKIARLVEARTESAKTAKIKK